MNEERLNHYKEWIEDNEEIIVDSSIFEELVKEIERLTKQNKALNEMYELTKKEYIRLNNIINELEERLEEGKEDNIKEYNLKSQMAVFVLRDVLELIEDLKEKYEILDKGE